MDQATGAAVGGVIGVLLGIGVGLLVGVVAKFLMPGRDPGGWVVTLLLGIAGSWVGTYLSHAVGGVTTVLGSFAAAVAGAMVLLAAYRLLRPKA